MNEFTIKLDVSELADAVNRLAVALVCNATPGEKPQATPSGVPEAAPPRLATADDTPKPAPAPMAAPGPADGGNGPAPAPGNKRLPAPTAEQVRAKGIEASRKYGKEAVVAILQKFGASGMSAIAEKDRAAFLAELERLGEGNA